MPSSEPAKLLDSWLGDGVEGFTISAVWRNLGVWGERSGDALALAPISHSLWRGSLCRSDESYSYTPKKCHRYTKFLTQF